MKFTIAACVIAAAASGASAFVVPTTAVRSMAPATARSSTSLYGKGKYDGELWDEAAKNDVKSTYDASQPRSETNFDPFEVVSDRLDLGLLSCSGVMRSGL